MDKSRIAVIGSGISGLSAAWLLRDTADVALLESEARFGGHSHTFSVPGDAGEVPVDTGFMVFNRPNYPLLSRLFEELGVRTHATDMSFSVSLDQGRLEYAGSSLSSLFAQRSNLRRPSFWRMLADIVRFNRAAKGVLRAPTDSDAGTLRRFLDRHRLGERFRQDYLYPMAAAIWSCPRESIGDFPARSFVRFFANHGLIDLYDRPQWQTLDGGSRSYVSRMIADLGAAARANTRVLAVRRDQDGVVLRFEGERMERFDQVVFACHSDQTLRLLQDVTPSEKAMLQAVPYQNNRVILHADPALMPVRKAVWSSWNYFDAAARSGNEAVSVTYWMNSLQRLPTQRDYFVTLNPVREPDPDQVIAEFDYAHPVFDAESQQLSSRLETVQGRDRAWFCGAWTGYGFHEDGLRSGVDVALRLGASLPWGEQIEASRALSPPRVATLSAQQA